MMKSISEKRLKQMKSNWIQTATDTVEMIFLLALHDEYGFGEQRLTKVLRKVEFIADSISEKRLNIRDIQQVLEEETGVTYKLKGDK